MVGKLLAAQVASVADESKCVQGFAAEPFWTEPLKSGST
jgi:hypothetical protein